jgi:uncharacterized protein DUF955
MRAALRALGIGLQKKVDLAAKHGSGAVIQEGDEYKIVLRRSTAEARPLSRRERFTLAHELGHILLLTRFGWNPQAGADYFMCEDWCDLFASHLLVPVLAGPSRFFAAQDALTALHSTARRYNVSFEVAARRITELAAGVAYISGWSALNSKSESIFKIEWATSSIVGFQLRRGSHLPANNALASKLLDNVCEFEVPDIGAVCVHVLNKGLRAAIKTPADNARHFAETSGELVLSSDELA